MDTCHVIEKDERQEFTTSGMDDEIRENYKGLTRLAQLSLLPIMAIQIFG